MANCQRCGADVPVGAAKCEYCGSAVALPKEAVAAETAREPGGAPPSVPASPVRFKRVSVGLMVVFTLITLGIYLGAWFFVRRGQFAELSAKAKNARPLFGGLLGVQIFYVLGVLAAIGNPDSELISALNLFQWVLLGLMVYSAAIARAALAEVSASRGSNFAGSMLWTVFFNALYLQSQINRMIDARALGAAS